MAACPRARTRGRFVPGLLVRFPKVLQTMLVRNRCSGRDLCLRPACGSAAGNRASPWRRSIAFGLCGAIMDMVRVSSPQGNAQIRVSGYRWNCCMQRDVFGAMRRARSCSCNPRHVGLRRVRSRPCGVGLRERREASAAALEGRRACCTVSALTVVVARRHVLTCVTPARRAGVSMGGVRNPAAQPWSVRTYEAHTGSRQPMPERS